MKEQLVEMTGLSPRVIRVWFQNKRCKHNKKTNALKMQMEQEKVSKAHCMRMTFNKSSFIRTRK
jgi:Homeodomain